ncbi:hypothetical protein P0Y35_09075 [Kiritimatiellaeota bacterium B1221]|nr:hypothetical protein [Kiritimatiellaeota bacterium B1221]
MKELFEASFNVVNLPATLLLIMILLHWIIVIIGAMDMISIDSELDFELDMDGEGGGFDKGDFILEYFNAKYIPISILMSIFALSFWAISMYANWYIHQNENGWMGLAIFAGNLIVSAHITKFATQPLIPIFKSMREQMSDNMNLVGKTVIVTSSKADAKFGQGQIRLDGPEITLNVRTAGEELPRGTEAVILQHEPATDIYLITQLEI